jgi:hypothetical protein
MPKEGQTANRLPPNPPQAAAGRKKTNLVLIYWLVCVCVCVCACVCVFLMQLSSQFVNTTQIACPTNLVSQRRIILQPNFLKIKNKKFKKINSIKEPSNFLSLYVYIL